MKLSKEQGEKLDEHLRRKFKLNYCDLCNSKDIEWSISDTIFELRGFLEKGGIALGGPVTPVIIITCPECGNMKLLNAKIIGLIEQEKENNKDNGANGEK